MSSSITGCSFTLTHLQSQAYELAVTFSNDADPCISKKQFDFIQDRDPAIPEIVDIYSQNGTCPKVVDQLFTKQKGLLFTAKDEKSLEQAAQKWDKEKPISPSLVVLDLKDEHQTYKNKAHIKEGELAFCAFLQKDPIHLVRRAQKIYHLFQQSFSLDFVLCEGALKCDLLPEFSDLEAEYFLQSRKGRQDLCQYAEFYMNAFKLGQTTRAFMAQDYFLNPANRSFKPALQSTVWYPAAYEELYSIDSPFFDVMRPIFSLQGSKDPMTRISSITVQRFS